MSFQADSSIVAGQLRIAALAIAAYEIVWTIPAEYIFYKRATTPKKVLLAATRYLGIAALVANCALYFSSYDQASCRRVHLLPGILQLFLGIVQQVVLFDKTYELARRDRTALSVMIFAMLITLPLEGIAVGLNREPTLFVSVLTEEETNGCLSLVREGVFNAGPVFYLSHLGFDILAICLSVYHLYKHTEKSAMPMQIIRHGVALMLLDAFVNTLTFLASLGVNGISKVGSLPSIAIAVTVTQHILLMGFSNSLEKANCYHLDGIEQSPAPGTEFKHEVIALPHTMGTKVYKGSEAHFQSTGSLPQFANSRNLTPLSHNRPGYGKRHSIAAASDRLTAGAGATGAHRSTPSIDGSTSVFHSCVGREALKFRVDGDINMFQSKTSLCAPTTPTDDLSKNPIALDIKRMSQQREAAAKRLSGRSIGRPETAKSDDLSSIG